MLLESPPIKRFQENIFIICFSDKLLPVFVVSNFCQSISWWLAREQIRFLFESIWCLPVMFSFSSHILMIYKVKLSEW